MTTTRDKVYLISNGDMRDSAGQLAWPKQEETLKLCEAAFAKQGVATEVLTRYNPQRRHGFLTKQCEGAVLFSALERTAPVVVVLSCWAYAHHVTGQPSGAQGPHSLAG